MLGIGHAREIEKIGIEFDFTGRNFHEALPGGVSDPGGGREIKIEGVQHEDAIATIVRVERRP
jgi:hypothetical protein